MIVYLFRTNAFEVVGVNSASTGVVLCEDSRSLADWIRAITNNISALLSHMVSRHFSISYIQSCKSPKVGKGEILNFACYSLTFYLSHIEILFWMFESQQGP